LPRLAAGSPDAVLELVNLKELDDVFLMGDPHAYPVRCTFLHFRYPEVVPLFDKQVMIAVGIPKDQAGLASHDQDHLHAYARHAYALVGKYSSKMPVTWPESHLRMLDMALWARDWN
jgi:hypothetical protein